MASVGQMVSVHGVHSMQIFLVIERIISSAINERVFPEFWMKAKRCKKNERNTAHYELS